MNEQQRILIIDDDPQNIKVAANALRSPELVIGFARSGTEALERLHDTPFDLVLMDVMMPGMDGYQVCEKIKSDPRTASIPVLFLTARTDEESIEKAYASGGVDYISKPIRSRELIARVKSQLRQLKMMRNLEFLATRDSLTGVFNRRKFFELGETLFANQGTTLTALMIDVDHFKQINDSHGHQVGDETLKAIASTIESVLPEDAILGRLGGEEFAVLLPSADPDKGVHIAESIREKIASSSLLLSDGDTLTYTVSIGHGTGRDTLSLDALLKVADDMLYCAKREGRNRTRLRTPG
jgi:diguanylate cyclase (GGDEF)-like protein